MLIQSHSAYLPDFLQFGMAKSVRVEDIIAALPAGTTYREAKGILLDLGFRMQKKGVWAVQGKYPKIVVRDNGLILYRTPNDPSINLEIQMDVR